MVLKTASENYNATFSEKIKITERSIFSSHNIFSTAALKGGILTSEQFKNIRQYFEYLKKQMIRPDFIIYLRTDPIICYDRMTIRNRSEENSVSLEYLNIIHRLHEKLFIDNSHLLPCIVIVLNGDDERDDVSKKFINFIETFVYKRCSKCHFKKTSGDFFRFKDGLQSYCKDCNRKNCATHMNEKYKDPKFYELQKMRNSLSRCNTLSSLSAYLGCTKQFLNDWLNFQRRGENIVEEELDHVLPVSKFGDKPEVIFHWVNIRPLSQKENRQKKAKVDFKLFGKQIEISKYFMRHYIFQNDIEKTNTINNFSNIFK